jgi:16S rRNA (adenine1518-N6/adenine1519-N6)-dimethyltransferase
LPLRWRHPATVKHIPRKRFGQHFLADAAVLDAIVRAIAPRPGDAMVEIGPGLGAMTRPLLAQTGHLTVIELDRDLAARLRKMDRITVVESDVLKVGFDQASRPRAASDSGAFQAVIHAPDHGLRIVGNLPYNISSPILFHLLPFAHLVQDQHFMLQKEVVDRMVAEPSTAAYGRLSVVLQWRYAMEDVLFVPPEAFDPPPRVDSAVVRMLPRGLGPQSPWPSGWDRVDATMLEELVRVAFSQRRKLLRHTLGRWLEQHAHSTALTTAFDTQRRAEEVPVAEYVALAISLTGHS